MNKITYSTRCRKVGFAQSCSQLRVRLVSAAASQTSQATIQDATADLLPWAVSRGAKADKVCIQSVKGVRGLKATDDIAKGEDIALVPKSAAVWIADTSQSPCPDVVDSSFFRSAPRQLKLAIALLHERGLGEKSKAHGYMTTLPDEVDVPCLWDDQSLGRIKNGGLRDRIREQTKQWHTWYKQLKSSSPSCPWTEAELQRALSVVGSRTFTGPYIASTAQSRTNLLLLISGATALTLTFGSVPDAQVLAAALSCLLFNALFDYLQSRQVSIAALCPLIDMANHSSATGAEVSFSYFQDAFFAAAGAPYARGEQVFVSYGAQTTDSLLQYYAFVEEGNASDVYTLYGVGAALRGAVAGERWGEIERGIAERRRGLVSLDKVVMSDKAQVQEEVKAALRYGLGVAPSLQEAAEKVSNKADAVVWQFLLEAALADREENGIDVKQERLEIKAAQKMGDTRGVLIGTYNVMKAEFLQGRIEQLERRVRKMRGGS